MEIIKRIFIVSYGLRLRFVFIITDDQPLSSLMDGFCHQRALVLGGRNALRPYGGLFRCFLLPNNRPWQDRCAG